MKRVKILGAVFVVSVLCLCARLFYVSVIDGDRLAKMAMAQRTEKIMFTSPRGIIYDRNMIKLADSEMKAVVKDGKPYYVHKRTNGMLNHVIGYISGDGSGCGIEGAFNYVLSSKDTSSISYLTNINRDKESEGYAFNIDKNYSGVCLTIDYHIQKVVEEAMDNHNINGAAIVVDCSSGEIVAMASRPDFDRQNLADFLDGKDGELVNKCIAGYNPGSVFKTVVTAAALENSASQEAEYECKGSIEIGGREYVCHNKEGHGRLTIREAFAQSCNCVFYQIGIELGMDKIYACASSFGIGRETLNINGIAEDKGYVPRKEFSDGAVANASIGQGDVMVTPLQIADIFCTVCNEGVRKQLTLIKGMVDSEGKCNNVRGADVGRVVSRSTAKQLEEMLTLAVEDGTGNRAQIKDFGAGGKTGSAETGWKKDGQLMQQGWFAGFFPKSTPRYVCVVMAENGKSGNDSACPVFSEIGTRVCQLEL